jgi:hypothetical protein
VDVQELAFDLFSLLFVFLAQGPAKTFVMDLAASAHGLSTLAAWGLAVLFGVLFIPSTFLIISPLEDEKPGGVLMALFLVPTAFAILVLPPLVLEELAARPPRGNAALASILGLFILNLLLMAVMVSSLDALGDWVDDLAADHGIRLRGGFLRLVHRIYLSVILPQLLWLVVLLEVHPLGMVLLMAFRVCYLFSGATGLVNLVLLGLTVGVWLRFG